MTKILWQSYRKNIVHIGKTEILFEFQFEESDFISIDGEVNAVYDNQNDIVIILVEGHNGEQSDHVFQHPCNATWNLES